MDNVCWQAPVAAATLGLTLSFLVERQLLPGTFPVWRRHPATLGVHAGLWVLLFAAELAAFQRPWLASANALALVYVLILINNAKFESLREPLIYPDVDYFVDVLRHPRLYLPYLGIGRSAFGAGVIALALYAGMMLESSLAAQVGTENFLIVLGIMVSFAVLLLAITSRQVPPASFMPEDDVRQLGLMACLWRYAWAERVCRRVPTPFLVRRSASPDAAVLPNLVIVQSESFFDVRKFYAGIRPEVLQHYDRMQASAVYQGRLDVPAWGANTVRTEFAFLSAIAPPLLGVHQFNPYRKYARNGCPTLASFLKMLGYRTICLHPYAASFYGRDRVYPQLGFDEFVDIRSFNNAPKAGPFVGDLALGERVCSMLDDRVVQPVLVFVITMENHGPLHLENLEPGDAERLCTNTPPRGCDDLLLYLRHLRNADRMLGMLRARLEALSRPGWLCWYGDHVPIMPNAYGVLGVPDGKTDYLVWHKDCKCTNDGIPRNLKVENLSPLLVQQMGLGGMLAVPRTSGPGWAPG